MAICHFVVLTNAVEGREGEYNDWYSNRHLIDVVAIPGVIAAQRFTLASAQRRPDPAPYKYLAVYEMEEKDIPRVVAALSQRRGTDAMPISSAMADQKFSFLFTPMTDRIVASEPG